MDRAAPLNDLPRHAAFVVLARQSKLWPDVDLLALDRTVADAGARLSSLDQAFVHALYDTCVRRWVTLKYFIGRELSQPIDQIEPRVLAALLGGSAQLIFMDRVPAHAAINHAVEWAKMVVRPGAGALVNAVLRKVAGLVPEDRTAARRERFTAQRDELPLSDGSAITLTSPVLPEDAFERLGIATSCPRTLLDHWKRSRRSDEVTRLAMHTLVNPPTVLHTACASGPIPPEIVAHADPGRGVFVGGGRTLSDVIGTRGDVWVQDSASAAAVETLRSFNPAPRFIIDLCAGRGTKTRQLAALFPAAQIIATEIDEARLEALRRMFTGHAQVMVESLKRVKETRVRWADLVLLDVPCSNTGVLARRPEAKYRFDDQHLRSLVSVQKQIIADTIPLLIEAPRGRILYSTCSIENEENGQQALWAARWHGFRARFETTHLPRGLPGEDAAGYADGAFSVLLE